MKILMMGDIVGAPGRTVFSGVVGRMKHRGEADFVVANAENAAGGKGLTLKLADELLAAGADVLTLGDHTWDQKELASQIDRNPRVIRPANFAPGCPGRGWVTVDTAFGRVTVINLIGRVFMLQYDCPFRTVDAILKSEPNLGRVVIVDIHAETTSERVAMGRYLDGRVSVVAGTHTHVQTADERVLPKGTAYITDLGMNGPTDSVIGREASSVMMMFLKGMPSKFVVAEGPARAEGVVVEVDEKTGRATSIRRVREE